MCPPKLVQCGFKGLSLEIFIYSSVNHLFQKPNREFLTVDNYEGVPFHRVRYYKFNGEKVWDRDARLDILSYRYPSSLTHTHHCRCCAGLAGWEEYYDYILGGCKSRALGSLWSFRAYGTSSPRPLKSHYQSISLSLFSSLSPSFFLFLLHCMWCV